MDECLLSGQGGEEEGNSGKQHKGKEINQMAQMRVVPSELQQFRETGDLG